MLEILVGLKKVTSEMAMKAKQEYLKFLTHVGKPNTESSTNLKNPRIDWTCFFGNIWVQTPTTNLYGRLSK